MKSSPNPRRKSRRGLPRNRFAFIAAASQRLLEAPAPDFAESLRDPAAAIEEKKQHTLALKLREDLLHPPTLSSLSPCRKR